MSKGAGSVGSGGVRAAVVRALGRLGGLHRAEFLRVGMRAESLTYWRSRFAGLSPSAAQSLATRGMPPVRVSIFREGGRVRVALDDGRHRMQAAQEAGATKIQVTARIAGVRGALSTTWTGVVRI